MFDIHALPFDARVQALLDAHHLPTTDLRGGADVRLFGCSMDDRLLGVVGIEPLGPDALLRSLVVPADSRGTGLGSALVGYAEAAAARHGARTMYLLTETATRFFERLGYRPVARSAAPPLVAGTTQFSGLCPAAADFMAKSLQP